MNVKKSLSILLVYVLLLTVAPIDFLVNQVQAEGKFAKNYQNDGIISYNNNYGVEKYGSTNYNGNYGFQNYNLNYLYQSMYIYNVDNDKNSTIVVAGDETTNYKTNKIVKINLDGTTKTIKANISSNDKYLGVRNGKVYYFNQGSNYGYNVITNYGYNYNNNYSYNYCYNTYDYSGTFGSINSIDLKTGKEKKEYNVKIPSLKGVRYMHISGNKGLKKDGTIVMKLEYMFDNFGQYSWESCLLIFRNNKESMINLKEKAIYDNAGGFDVDSKGNLWTSSPGINSLVKIDKNNNVTTYKVDMPNGYGFIYGGFVIDNQDNAWATIGKYDYTNSQFKEAIVKVAINNDKAITRVYDFNNVNHGTRELKMDSKGQMWFLQGGTVNKLENDEFVTKYSFNTEYPIGFSVIDDKHVLVADYNGYMYINK